MHAYSPLQRCFFLSKASVSLHWEEWYNGLGVDILHFGEFEVLTKESICFQSIGNRGFSIRAFAFFKGVSVDPTFFQCLR